MTGGWRVTRQRPETEEGVSGFRGAAYDSVSDRKAWYVLASFRSDPPGRTGARVTAFLLLVLLYRERRVDLGPPPP